MRKSISNKLLLISCVLAFAACKARKLVVVTPKTVETIPTVNPAADKINTIRKNQAEFTTFSGKARTKLDINGSTNDVTLNIRIQKGQKIWVSITAIAGIEVARALITPDSLLVINKLQGLYLRKPFGYVYTYTSKQVDYRSLEALLVGNAIPQLLNDQVKLNTDNGQTILSGNLEELMYKMIVGPDMKVSHSELTDQAGQQSLLVDNSIFIQSGARVVPSQIDMKSVAKSKKIQVSLHYIKVDFDQPLEYPFSIPSRYSEAN